MPQYVVISKRVAIKQICVMFDFHKETENSFCETIKDIVAQIHFVQYAH